MEKETSCINAIAILDYLKKENIDYTSIIDDLSPEIDGLKDPESFLRDPNNWISCSVISKMYERATAILQDENAAYKMGRRVTDNFALGYTQRIVVKAFWSHKKALKHCQKINDQFNRNKKVELYELKQNKATIRLHWDPHMASSKHICQYNQGVYTSLPIIWGGKPLVLKEECCYFDGAPYCEYHLKWPFKNKFHEFFSRFFTSRSVLKDIIKEMEKDKKTIEEKTEKLSNMNKELHHEITERKEIEMALRVSERRFRDLAEMLPEAVFEADIDMNLTFVNEYAFSLFGYSKQDFENGLNGFDMLVPEERKLALDNITKRFRGEESAASEYRGLKKDGTTFPMLLHSSPIIHSGAVKGVRGIIVDISKLKRMESQLQQAQKVEAIGTLTGGIAHDYNNLMAIVIGNLSMAMEEAEPGSFLWDFLNEASRASSKVRDLTHELMSLSRGGAPVKEVGSLESLLKSATDVIPVENGISIKESISQDLKLVQYDQNQMGAVFRNVVTNAYEAMPNGGTIRIKAENLRIEDMKQNSHLPIEPGDYIHISIQDQGKGIPKEFLDKIFDPYFSTKARGVKKGMGLGLTTAHAIVSQHRGHIAIDTSFGAGTTVNIYLPAVSRQAESETKTPLQEDFTSSKKRVLVMDDEDRLRNLAEKMLERLGYAVETVKDGVEAIEAYKRQKDSGEAYDAVILDLTIKGGMGGEQTIRELLKIDPGIKAIVSSGYFNDPVMADFRKYGFKGAMSKPYKKKSLEEMLEKLFE
ncbi:MAG: PAS domain S-box protein [Deltaproteobacteria bacterium]|nr:PAS domain S-box protein [Deltaproteobacteria bacterium]